MSINCCECGSDLDDIVDTTYANYTSDRVSAGSHTGDIYECKNCELLVIDDLLNKCIRVWVYA